MKKLKKRTAKKTVEAYTCSCPGPDDCVAQCINVQESLQYVVYGMALILTGRTA